MCLPGGFSRALGFRDDDMALSPADIAHLLREHALLPGEALAELERVLPASADAPALLREGVRRQWLTTFQVNEINQGRGAALALGDYVLMGPLGGGGMGQVFLAW